nr:MAG TPA: hypothetical protein [Caudoviricetes sp.]
MAYLTSLRLIFNKIYDTIVKKAIFIFRLPFLRRALSHLKFLETN